MLRIVLVQPGSTDFDDQGRIKGSLDIPLSANGTGQVTRMVEELMGEPIEAIYAPACQSALQTAQALAEPRHLKVKTVPKLKNLDHGLWHGKLIDEVRQNQPKVYRHWRENPELACPPEGESIAAARERAQSAVAKILKKHRRGTIALVIPEPLASVVRGFLRNNELDDLWQAETDVGGWTLIEINKDEVPVRS
ncbi:MAG: histidine phosphatase family protein [Pirellulaceae bacterium]